MMGFYCKNGRMDISRASTMDGFRRHFLWDSTTKMLGRTPPLQFLLAPTIRMGWISHVKKWFFNVWVLCQS